MELVSIELELEDMQTQGMGRYEAVTALAERLGITKATLYRWEKGGDYFIVDEESGESVFKLVTHVLKDE